MGLDNCINPKNDCENKYVKNKIETERMHSESGGVCLWFDETDTCRKPNHSNECYCEIQQRTQNIVDENYKTVKSLSKDSIRK
jgi:hypothetical protein